MNIGDISKIICSLIIGILVLTGIMVPIIDSSINDQVTKFNNPTAEYMMLDEGENYEASITVTDGVFETVINGETFTDVFFDHLYISDTSQITFNERANIKPIVIVLSEGEVTRVADCDAVTVIANDGNIEISVVKAGVTTTYATSFDWFIHSAENGDYGVIRPIDGRTIYFNDVDQLIWSNIYSVDGGVVYRTLYDGKVNANGEYLSNIEYTGDQIFDNLTAVSMSVNDAGFSYDVGGESITLTWIVAPIEVIGYDNSTRPILVMLEILPILVAIGLLIGSIGALVVRRT